MKKTLIISLGAFILSMSAVIGAQDYFLKNLELCNPYKTVYKSPLTGEFFEKGILGVKTESTTHNLYCVYYKQLSKNEYQLCQQRTNSLPGEKASDKKVDCKTVGIQAINSEQKAIEDKDMFMDISTEVTIKPIKKIKNTEE